MSHWHAFGLAFIASMGTLVGGILVILLGQVMTTTSPRLIGILQSSSAGVMLYMTFLDLIPESIEHIGRLETMNWFFGGAMIFMLLELVVLHQNDDDLKRMGWITFVALFLHNIPEGLGVYLSAMADLRMGLQLAVAIMLHNIPEGMACAIPIWAATRSSSQVISMTLLNGLAEPLGVVIGGYIMSEFMSEYVLHAALAMVGGIMASISFQELFPAAIKFSGKNCAVLSLLIGMFVCFVALETVDLFFEHSHHH